ncbi:MAG: hypothetical protein L0Z62_35290 [Gemmataceae bacterium]|nr:hypothetical protein [Gemmataceae bacterium]
MSNNELYFFRLLEPRLPVRRKCRASTATREPDGVHECHPGWSPDGRSIAYFSDAGGAYALHVRPANTYANGVPRW